MVLHGELSIRRFRKGARAHESLLVSLSGDLGLIPSLSMDSCTRRKNSGTARVPSRRTGMGFSVRANRTAFRHPTLRPVTYSPLAAAVIVYNHQRSSAINPCQL